MITFFATLAALWVVFSLIAFSTSCGICFAKTAKRDWRDFTAIAIITFFGPISFGLMIANLELNTEKDKFK